VRSQLGQVAVCATSQKMAFFTVTAVKASNLTKLDYFFILDILMSS
jgi:hypothetical protein